jgi:hypothetical protein
MKAIDLRVIFILDGGKKTRMVKMPMGQYDLIHLILAHPGVEMPYLVDYRRISSHVNQGIDIIHGIKVAQ